LRDGPRVPFSEFPGKMSRLRAAFANAFSKRPHKERVQHPREIINSRNHGWPLKPGARINRGVNGFYNKPRKWHRRIIVRQRIPIEKDFRS